VFSDGYHAVVSLSSPESSFCRLPVGAGIVGVSSPYRRARRLPVVADVVGLSAHVFKVRLCGSVHPSGYGVMLWLKITATSRLKPRNHNQ